MDVVDVVESGFEMTRGKTESFKVTVRGYEVALGGNTWKHLGDLQGHLYCGNSWSWRW